MAQSAELRVFDRLRSALPAEYRLYPNVRWISKRDANSPARDGETDLLIVHPENGLLVVETRGRCIRRDGLGRWFSGEHELNPPPFEQAENSKHALAAKLTSLPDWPHKPTDLRARHAVAFPDVGVHTAATRSVGLGPDTDLALIFDQADLTSDESARLAVDRAHDSGWVIGGVGRSCGLSGKRRSEVFLRIPGSVPMQVAATERAIATCEDSDAATTSLRGSP
jgi:hypothetical protein